MCRMQDITLTPTVEDDGPALRALHAAPEVARWWELPDPGFPMHDEPELTRFTVREGREIAGLVQYGEEEDPKYRSASVDIFLGPAFHGRGIGTRAIRMVLDVLVHERGHHRITIDPAADNHAAIRCYEKAGFQRVGIMRRAERDSDGNGWHDALLLEYVVDQPPAAVAVRRIVPNLFDADPAATRAFYTEVFGLDVAMDLGWITTLASPANPAAQVSVLEPGAEEGRAPFISVEVTDVDALHARALDLGHEVAYSLRDEDWGVRRFMVRDPGGRVVNVLSHRPR
jgi:RimJ/RimL family protein N-acetyltransferase/catechol 2,3-dioxygenase-like lactoylglutathione lyase family enzyme